MSDVGIGGIGESLDYFRLQPEGDTHQKEYLLNYWSLRHR